MWINSEYLLNTNIFFDFSQVTGHHLHLCKEGCYFPNKNSIVCFFFTKKPNTHTLDIQDKGAENATVC
jgi:hypothetical protein